MSRPISLDTARRRSVGESAPHVAAPYSRALIGDAERQRRRSPWEDHPRIDWLTRLAVVVGVCAAGWIVALALVVGVWAEFIAVFG